jgi:two-component system chemotaxis response regulator CheY
MKILIVDDDFVALTLMSRLLSKFGECDVATHGGQAIEMFMESCVSGHPYNLMTIDIEMPDVNGLKVLQAICMQEEKLGITPAKKMMISMADSNRNKIAAAGFKCEFMAKPVRKEALFKKLCEMGVVKEQEQEPVDA